MKELSLQFGGKITEELEKQYEQSENWQDGKFQNLEKTEMAPEITKLPGLIYKHLTSSGQNPEENIAILPFDKKEFLAPSDKSKIIWYGHSVVLMRINGKTLLIDPMMGPDTTPITPIINQRFTEDSLSIIDRFPDIDCILLSHDHYDHLDYKSIMKLKDKAKKYYVALGIKRHLVRWGVDPDLIIEFDWWDSKILEDVNITFTPTRHFSGRGITDRFKSLWGGWVFKTQEENIWFSGDSGYGEHFKIIGNRLGPFDFAMMECGQYSADWPLIHMFPEESIKAALDAKVRKAMPVHWAGFALSYEHTWQEPGDDFVKLAKKGNLDYLLPKMGQIFTYSETHQQKWWKA